MKNLTVFFCIAFLLASCDYDVAEELYPVDGCDTRDLSYSMDIIPIIDANCYRCHDAQNNFGNVTLEGYNNIKVYVDNGKLIGTIKHEDGFSPMPQDAGQIDQCSIDKVAQWINDGAENN